MMKNNILADNNALRLSPSLLMLICFALPLPNMSGMTHHFVFPFGGSDLGYIGIASCYIVAIPLAIFFKDHILTIAKLSIVIRFITVLAMFLPLSSSTMITIHSVQFLCDAMMIVLEVYVPICLFTKESIIKALCLTLFIRSGLGVALELGLPMSFTIFRVYIVLATVGWLYFYCRLPKAWPRYVHKTDKLVPPRAMFVIFFSILSLSAFFIIFGQEFAITINHIDILFGSTAISIIAFYLLWKCAGINPFKILSAVLLLGAVGFIFVILSEHSPAISVAACVLIGLGSIIILMNSHYAYFLIERYPSRFILPLVSLAMMISVLLYTLLLSLISNTELRYGIYLLVTIIFAMLYLIIYPYMAHSLYSKPASMQSADNHLSKYPFAQLSGQELRLAELIMQGYTHPEIIKVLNVSDNTVRGYRKTLYSKLQIHSKRELFELAEKD